MTRDTLESYDIFFGIYNNFYVAQKSPYFKKWAKTNPM